MHTPMADTAHMQHALELAQHALRLSQPNPRVGCVLVNPQGAVIGSGHTQAVGGAHAEVMALRAAAQAGASTQGATAYVTLEPCAHTGHTPPCCDALLAAGITRVVAAVTDPNPRVAGAGLQRLRAAGVDVSVGLCQAEAVAMNIGFFSRMQRGRPWLRMKMATSLDGVSALPNGQSQWITSAQARADGHAWRARACAILTGYGTVRDDNPRLDVREVTTPRQPHVVVVDSRCQTPVSANIWLPQRQRFWAHATANVPPTAVPPDTHALYLPQNNGNKVDLQALLQVLAEHQVNEVHAEAGAALNGSLLQAGLVDEILLYQAPLWLGQGALASGYGPLLAPDQGMQLQWLEDTRVGPDRRTRVLTPQGAAFWQGAITT